jgi:transcriptional regulator with XRE-family HTH domain
VKTAAFQNLGKERRAEQPGAKLGNTNNNGGAGHQPRENQLHTAAGNSRVSNTPNFRGLNANIFSGQQDRNFNGNVRNIFRGELKRAPAFELTTHDWNALSAEAISEFMRCEDLSLKELGRLIGCSDRTVENYLNGRTAPQGVHFLRCFAVIPTFEALVKDVCDKAGGIDPRALHRAAKLAQEATRFLSALGVEDLSDSSDAFAGEDRDVLTGDLFQGHC